MPIPGGPPRPNPFGAIPPGYFGNRPPPRPIGAGLETGPIVRPEDFAALDAGLDDLLQQVAAFEALQQRPRPAPPMFGPHAPASLVHGTIAANVIVVLAIVAEATRPRPPTVDPFDPLFANAAENRPPTAADGGITRPRPPNPRPAANRPNQAGLGTVQTRPPVSSGSAAGEIIQITPPSQGPRPPVPPAVPTAPVSPAAPVPPIPPVPRIQGPGIRIPRLPRTPGGGAVGPLVDPVLRALERRLAAEDYLLWWLHVMNLIGAGDFATLQRPEYAVALQELGIDLDFLPGDGSGGGGGDWSGSNASTSGSTATKG